MEVVARRLEYKADSKTRTLIRSELMASAYCGREELGNVLEPPHIYLSGFLMCVGCYCTLLHINVDQGKCDEL